MRKLMFAAVAAAGVGLTAADAKAQFGSGPLGAPPPEMAMPGPGPGCSGPGCGGEGAGRYGWNPIFKKVFWWKKDKACGAGCAVPAPPGAPGGPQVGTLVFPNHQFNRSPRDYFMFGQGGY